LQQLNSIDHNPLGYDGIKELSTCESLIELYINDTCGKEGVAHIILKNKELQVLDIGKVSV